MNRQKILLADDTELFLQLEKTFLNRQDVDILTASNGSRALELARLHSPDLVFLDLNMPEMDGDACCRAIKDDPKLKQTPIVMVTTEGRSQDFERCQAAGCDGILLKPIKRSELVMTAQKFLRSPIQNKRYRAKIQVQYGKDVENSLTEFSINISSGGLFLCTQNPLEVGEILLISFLLTGQKKQINCNAQIAWVNSPVNPTKKTLPSGMGIRFLDLSLDDLHAIRDFIADNSLEPMW
jgi:uncharacterized protein (TIGR02266 family)